MVICLKTIHFFWDGKDPGVSEQLVFWRIVYLDFEGKFVGVSDLNGKYMGFNFFVKGWGLNLSELSWLWRFLFR